MPAQVMQFPQPVDRLSPHFPKTPVMVDFAPILRARCEEIIGSIEPAGRPQLVCTATPVLVRQMEAKRLARVAQGLISSACKSFIGGRGGRIRVELRALAANLEFMVEHSRPEAGTTFSNPPASEQVTRFLVADMGSVIEYPHVIGGSRTVVTVPRASWHPRRSSERGEGILQRRA